MGCEKMKKNCPLCYQKAFSELGKECKMCGMSLEDESNEFCSKTCRIKFDKIREESNMKRINLKLEELNLLNQLTR